MIYRVLRENEICDKGLGKGIYGKTFSMESYKSKTLGDALDNITSHISKGNTSKTEFISCSNNFCLDLEKYASEQLDLRPYLAVINNHDKSIIECEKFDFYAEKLKLIRSIIEQKDRISKEEQKDLIRSDDFLDKIIKHGEKNKGNAVSRFFIKESEFEIYYPEIMLKRYISGISQSDIKRLVIDASKSIYDDSVYKFFFDNEMICNRSGFTKTCYNQRECGTAKNSGELIVLNYISENDIKILNPLQYDIIYGLCMNYSFGVGKLQDKIFEQIDIFCEDNYEIIESMLTEQIEKKLFRCMYKERKPIYELATTEKGFKNIIGLKKNILCKCIEFLNISFNEHYSKSYIPTIEGTIDLYKSPVIKIENGKILRKTL